MLAAACATGAFALSGCAKQQIVTGEMSYVSWGTTYGVKVTVQVQTDKKGDRIRKVEIAPSDLVEASPASGAWDPSVWDGNLQALLNAYRGEYVADVLALEVATDGSGAPLIKGDGGFENFGDDKLIAGATLGSGRLLLAVQNALKTFEGYACADGEYGYESWGTNYGAKVRVVAKDGVIQRVRTLSSDYTNATLTQSWKASLWYDAEADILAAYEGKTVEEVKAVVGAVEGQNGATGNSVSDSGLLASGATVSSARLLLAVQNALSKF